MCGDSYCKPCDRQCHCGYECVEACPEIPCLDCATYKVRKFFGMEVKGTMGSLRDKSTLSNN